jgi:hypothetical protein
VLKDAARVHSASPEEEGQRAKGCFTLQHNGKLQSVAWIAIGLVIIAAVVVIALILMNRPDNRAYQDAILVCAGVARL